MYMRAVPRIARGIPTISLHHGLGKMPRHQEQVAALPPDRPRDRENRPCHNSAGRKLDSAGMVPAGKIDVARTVPDGK